MKGDLLLIVGKNEAVRNSALFTLRHLIEPTGYLKTRITENGDIIAILKDSLHRWQESSSPQEKRRNAILENLSDGGIPQVMNSSNDAR